MIRRGFIASLVTAAFAPFVWIPNVPKRHGREVGRKGINGLEMIKWEDIREGDDIVAMDWTAGHLSAIEYMGVAQGRPNDLPGNPVPFENNPKGAWCMECDDGLGFYVLDCVKQ